MGLVTDDIVDYTSEEVKKWAPSFENYYLEKINDDDTRFTVEVDVDDEDCKLPKGRIRSDQSD